MNINCVIFLDLHKHNFVLVFFARRFDAYVIIIEFVFDLASDAYCVVIHIPEVKFRGTI